MKSKYLVPIAVVAIVLVAVVARSYKITIPLADHHSWRQADTAAVARNFAREEFNLLRPKIDTMSVQSKKDLPINAERYFLTEFPIYNALVAIPYKIFGVSEVYARAVTVAASVGSIVLVYLIGSYAWGRLAGLSAAFFLAVNPYAIYYGRVVLPEPTMVFFSLASIYLLLRIPDKFSYRLLLASAVLFALAALVKLYILFVAPALLYLLLRRVGTSKQKLTSIGIFFAITLLPLIAWRLYIQTIPEGIPDYTWLFNQNNIRFTGAFFHWMFVRRFDELILSALGISLFVIGLLGKPEPKTGWFFHLWFAGLLGYIVVIANGNVTHDYYQIIFLPLFMLFIGKACGFLLAKNNGFISRYAGAAYISVVLCSMVAFGWYEVRHFYNMQGGVDLAGAYITSVAPKDALVITGVTADTTLLYNTGRHGWTIGYGTPYELKPETIETLRAQGADYYVTTRIEDIFADSNAMGLYLKETYGVEKQTNQYIVINLNPKF